MERYMLIIGTFDTKGEEIGFLRDQIPLGGFSAIDAPGQPFFDPEANRAFIEALEKNLPSHFPVIKRETHINDPSFAKDVAQALLNLLRG